MSRNPMIMAAILLACFGSLARAIATTISTIETCIDHRRSIMNIFADALDKVRNHNDNDIKPLARTLRDSEETNETMKAG